MDLDHSTEKSLGRDFPYFAEEAQCPMCLSSHYRVLAPARYPTGLDREGLLGIYRSSSDHKLMDQLVECSQCELVYLNPRIKPELAIESYATAVDPVFVSQNPLRVRTFRRSLRKILKRTGMAPSPDRQVLDIGCAGGAFLKAATDEGFRGVGIEPSRWLCEFGKREYGLDLRPGLLEDHDFGPRSFDLVTMWDVLEHLHNPLEALTKCAGLVKASGYVIVNYPDYASLARRIFGSKWPFFLSVHLYYFTPQTIRLLLQKAGLEAVWLGPHWQTLELSYALERGAAYFSGLQKVKAIANGLGLSTVPLTYQIGQTLVIAKRCE